MSTIVFVVVIAVAWLFAATLLGIVIGKAIHWGMNS